MSEHAAAGGVKLSAVLELVGLLEFHPKFQKHGITDFNYFKQLTVQDFVAKCIEVGMSSLQIVMFKQIVFHLTRKIGEKEKHILKQIVEGDAENNLKHVLQMADLMEFHASFKQKGFTSFDDFFTLSDQDFVNCCFEVGLKALQIRRFQRCLNDFLRKGMELLEC